MKGLLKSEAFVSRGRVGVEVQLARLALVFCLSAVVVVVVLEGGAS